MQGEGHDGGTDVQVPEHGHGDRLSRGLEAHRGDEDEPSDLRGLWPRGAEEREDHAVMMYSRRPEDLGCSNSGT